MFFLYVELRKNCVLFFYNILQYCNTLDYNTTFATNDVGYDKVVAYIYNPHRRLF